MNSEVKGCLTPAIEVVASSPVGFAVFLAVSQMDEAVTSLNKMISSLDVNTWDSSVVAGVAAWVFAFALLEYGRRKGHIF